MAYPETPEAGEIVGRNFVMTPKFPDEAAHKWTGLRTFPADPAAYAGRCAAFVLPSKYSSDPKTKLGTLDPGQHGGEAAVLTIQYASTAEHQILITGAGSDAGDPLNSMATVTLPAAASLDDWQWATFPLTLPSGPFRDAYGSPIPATAYDMVVPCTTTDTLHIGALRLDFAGSTYGDDNGYLDGDTDLSEAGAAASWAGVALESVSEASATEPPEPDPEPEPDDEIAALAQRLAPRVAAFIGRAGVPEHEQRAEAQLPVVVHFVHEYTRGRGWTGYVPDVPLEAVIVSATARLAVNPSQAKYYSIADYSENPAVLNGYTLAERGILHNYRRRQA